MYIHKKKKNVPVFASKICYSVNLKYSNTFYSKIDFFKGNFHLQQRSSYIFDPDKL